MFCVVRYIYCSLAVLFMSLVSLDLYCQDCSPVNDENDSKLDYYEHLCGKCLSMKDLVLSGGSVSRHEASSLILEFLSLNKEIKTVMESLTESQRMRFERISIWFSSGKRPVALDDSQEALENINSDYMPEILVNEKDKVLYAFSDNNEDIGKCKTVREKLRKFVSVSLTYPLSYGLRIGLAGRRWGGYISGKSNFKSYSCEYFCNSNGELSNGMSFWSSGTEKNSIMSFSAGVIFSALKWVDIYFGAGYGHHKVAWQDIDGKWAEVSDLSHRGIAVEAGASASWNRLFISVGATSVNFRTAGLEIGVGFRF